MKSQRDLIYDSVSAEDWDYVKDLVFSPLRSKLLQKLWTGQFRQLQDITSSMF